MIQGFGLALRDESGWTFAAVDTMVQRRRLQRGDELHVPAHRRDRADPVRARVRHGAPRSTRGFEGRGLFLYIFLLPLAISDLAAGIAWSAIFTERGYLNTILEGVGVIEQPFIWLDPTIEVRSS